MRTIYKTLMMLTIVLTMISCNTEPSLQEYFVKQQENTAFISLDVPMSLLNNQKKSLDKDYQETLNTIKKINILALPIKDENKDVYAKELKEINSILKNDEYQTLMKFNVEENQIVLKYKGEEDAIDEIIVFGSSDNKGLGIARLIGNNMDPEKMVALAKSFDKGDIDVSQFAQIGNLFK